MAVILGMAAIGAWAVLTDRIGYVVTDGKSMNPIYYQGDLVVVVKADSYQAGQIVAYHGERPGQRVLHRIIGGSSSAGFVMKGDNNQSIDPVAPTAPEVIGRALLHVPHGGIWLKPVLGPSGLGTLSFLLISSGATAARTRREVPRGRRKKKVKSMSRRSSSMADAAAVLKTLVRLPVPLRVAAAVAAVLTLLALPLGVLGWMKPLLVEQTTPMSPAQSIAFSYSAKVPLSAAYDSTTVSAPDPIFRKLADHVDVHTRYVGPSGIFNLTAVLTNGTGWHTTLHLVKDTSFSGSSFNSTIALDLATLVMRADDAARVIGAPAAGSVSVQLNAQVRSGTLPDLNAQLPLAVTPLQMSLGNGAKLKISNDGGTASKFLVPREVRLFGHPVMTAVAARSRAVLFLACATGIAAAIFLLTRRQTSVRTRAEIERRYPQLLVHVEPMPSPPGKPVVTVDNFPALVKLAERYGQMILTWRRPDADDFVVRDEGITYRYRVPLDEPALQNVELIDRPGSHRRRAASEVS